jgi:hypothetical protein
LRQADPRPRVPTYRLCIGFFPRWRYSPNFGPWPTSMELSISLRFTRSETFGRTPWAGDQLVARPLPVHKHRKTHIHKHLNQLRYRMPHISRTPRQLLLGRSMRHYTISRKVAGSIHDEVIGLFFQLTQSFQPNYGPGIDSPFNRNEYQESSWGMKCGRRIRLHPHRKL